MKRIFSYRALFVFLALLLSLNLFAQNPAISNTNLKNSVGFIENKGQIHDQDYQPNQDVKYLLNLNNGLNVQLRANGFSYDLYSVDSKELKIDLDEYLGDSNKHIEFTYNFHRVDIELLNANPFHEIVPEDPSMEYLNFYNNVTDNAGVNFVRSFGKVTYRNIYHGIDLEFVTNSDSEKAFEYNFIIHPGADASDIRIKYNGADRTKLIGDKIYIETAFANLNESIPRSIILVLS